MHPSVAGRPPRLVVFPPLPHSSRSAPPPACAYKQLGPTGPEHAVPVLRHGLAQQAHGQRREREGAPRGAALVLRRARPRRGCQGRDHRAPSRRIHTWPGGMPLVRRIRAIRGRSCYLREDWSILVYITAYSYRFVQLAHIVGSHGHVLLHLLY